MTIGAGVGVAADLRTVEPGLEEVIVTAQKRAEPAQQTPVSMAVYTAADIAREGVIDMQTLTQTDTSLLFNRNGGEAALALRGVTNTVTTELGNPSVPVVVDNFATNRAYALDATLFDVDRIEVLRGPQGTLYGRSATGGLVNIVTVRPKPEFETAASIEVGNYDALNLTGTINIPFSDTFQVRVAGVARRHDGYRVNTYQPVNNSEPQRADDEDSQAGRFSAAFEPTGQFRAWLSFTDLQMGGAGPAIEMIPFTFVNPASPATSDVVHASPNLGDPQAFGMYPTPTQHINNRSVKWDLKYDGLAGGLIVSYVGGADSFDWRHSNSGINTPSFLNDPTISYLPYRPTIAHEHPDTQNHELRFTSPVGGAWEWQAGLYYFKESNSLYTHVEILPSQGAPPVLDNVDLIFFNYHVSTQAKAVFAQDSVKVSDEAKLTLGARYNEDDVARAGVFGEPILGIPASPNGVGSYHSSKSTWHLGYEWQPTDTHLVYAKLDTGYKPGGFDSCASYKPEDVKTAELGSKNRYDNDHLQANGAVFYDVYQNQQVQQFVASCATGSVTTNSGKSNIYGLEADLKALLDDVGRFDLGLTYLHATYDTFFTPPVIGPAGLPSCGSRVQVTPTGTNCDLSGNVMPSAPKLVLTAGFERDVAVDGGTVSVRVEGRYTGKQFFDPFNYADLEQDAYTLINAFINYSRNSWKVGLYSRNLADKAYLNYAANVAAGGATTTDYAFGTPRTFGVRAEMTMH